MQYLALDQAELIADGDLAPRITNDGYMVASARSARTGIQTYLGAELGRDGMSQVRVYRPESSVFDKASLASFSHKPATDDHPPVAVDASNHKKYAVGHIGEDIARDGEYVRVPLLLTDQSMIDKVRAGKAELSMGYSMTLDWSAGTTDAGEAYDAIQRDIRINHVAVVDRGRAGPSVRIGDAWQPIETKPEPKPPTQDGKSKMTLRTIVVDGISVETTDQGAQAIEKLTKENKQLADMASTDAKAAADTLKSTVDKLTTDHAAVVAEKEKELGAKDGEIKALKDAAMTPEKLDVLVADRSALIGKASQIVKDADFSGKTDEQIQAICVDAHYGESTAKDKSAEYVAGMFGAIKVSNDKFADVMYDRQPRASYEAVDMDAVLAARNLRLENAHKGVQK